ncbi:MAG: hypothetical protein HOG49_02120 [Candidatus Scalindua sp.]|jgi:hypothetical protein|nr:hypothetical protein [Candidatus Scalindua sp.]
MDESTKSRTYNILVYGVEKAGLTAPSHPIKKKNFTLNFEPFETSERFNEYDGVILFQGIFEKYEWVKEYWGSRFSHSYDINELDKRKKETQLLLKNSGFICFILNHDFADRADGKDFSGTDLSKYYLNLSNFYRENFGDRRTSLNIKYDEFRKFLELYGAANTYFSHYEKEFEWRVVADVSGYVVGMIMFDSGYFIPSLIPDNSEEVINEYFTLLAEGITSTQNKIHQDIPEWVDQFVFTEETELIKKRDDLESKIFNIDGHIGRIRNYKAILVLTGEELVAKVTNVFENGFGLSVDPVDELKEDIKLLDNDDKPFCLCEIKGTNKGVKRDHINQTDSHRDRSGYIDTFPAILIINTHIRSSRTILEKDQDVAEEQVKQAKKMGVLILRTLDLLKLLSLMYDKKINLKEIINLITKNHGWLKVNNDSYEII